MANRISIDTRRGSGNFIIASPVVSAALEGTSSFTIAPVMSNLNTAQPVDIIGTIDGRMKVIRDTFATTDDMLVGYKGPNTMDAGIIFSPYIQLMLSSAVFENSFNNTRGIMSRYGLTSNIFGSSNYYQRMAITDMP